ncbi:15416_t:CDS:2 [Acaulospora colombiana]|uniref:15416_t:CDS:1 n=1 Tax=Acaulospora colombiana TaxID=27376 RepID=A0ACA9LHR6_9GLOM|nr:15416_t:CDS:2 [Acaulospora colombiana]
MGQVNNNKNELFLLSKHNANASLSVPKIAFGASARTTASYERDEGSSSRQRSYEDNEKKFTEGGDTLSRQDTIDTDPRSFGPNHSMTDDEYFPSLEKVLMNKSGSPLSQYNFYSYLRQEWQGEENLNFWLDVVTHENLFESWREYQNRIKKARERNSYDEKGHIIYEEGDEYEEQEVVEDWEPVHNYHNSTSSAEGGAAASVDSKNPVISPQSRPYGHEITINPSVDYSRPETFKRISEDDLIKSAQSIYQKYGHMDILPEESRNTMSDLIERQGRYNPVVFSSAKSYVYHIMNVIYFPKFIQSAVDMNLTQIHAMIALPLGVVFLAFGFSLELYDIFMGWENPSLVSAKQNSSDFTKFAKEQFYGLTGKELSLL